MRFRKPELIPTLFIICAFALTMTLGTWQVQRLQWKNALVVDIEKAQALPELTTLPATTEGLDYQHVKLSGIFHHDKSMHTIGAAPGVGGNSGNGFHVITPFSLKDGRIILVDRGWAPPGKESKPAGTQTVSGIIRPPHPKRMFAPDNNAEKNVWFNDDIAAMSTHTGLKLTPLIVQAVGPQKKGIYPVPNTGKLTLRNDHLQYAITWFALAFIALVMFALYHRKTD